MSPKIRLAARLVLLSAVVACSGCGQSGDGTPVEVTATNPSAGAAGVPIIAAVTVTFSKPVDRTTVNAVTFTVETEGDGVAVAGIVDVLGASAVFTPTGPLGYSTRYRATVRKGVLDRSGNPLRDDVSWAFTTVPSPDPRLGDTTPPTVAAAQPASNATGVSVTTEISLTFSEPMDPQTVNPVTFLLADEGARTPVAGIVSSFGTRTVFVPTAPLDHAKRYLATLKAEATDLAGNPLGSDFTWRFTTAAVPGNTDTTAPGVTGTHPANDAVEVSPATVVRATFSEEMDPSTVNEVSFGLTREPDEEPVAGIVSYLAKTAVFTPTAPLQEKTTYRARLGTLATDLAGNPLNPEVSWRFTTAAPPSQDHTPPVVIGVSPVEGATVPVTTTIVVTLSEAMDSSSVNPATFVVQDAVDSIQVAGTVSCAAETVVFSPTAPLGYTRRYLATLKKEATDLAGNPLGADYSWSFSTEASPDSSPLAVLSTSPPESAVEVPVDTAFSAHFSKALDPSSVTGETFYLLHGVTGARVGGQVKADGDTATFSPDAPLDFGTHYTAILEPVIRDANGRNLPGRFKWTITTQARKWLAESSLADPGAENVSNPQTAVDGIGRIVVVWEQRERTRWSIWHTTYEPGVGWEPAAPVTTAGSGDNLAPRLGVSDSGEAHLVFTGGGEGRFDLYASHRAPGGSWTEPTVLEPYTAGSSMDPTLAVSSGGDAVAAWRQRVGSSTDAVFASRYLSGAGWSAPQLLSTDAGSSSEPAVALNGEGHGAAIWVQGDGTTPQARVAILDARLGWGTPRAIQMAPGSATLPRVALDPKGNAFAIWAQLNLQQHLWAARYDRERAGWSAALQLDRSFAVLGPADLAVDGEGSALVVWGQSDFGAYELVARRYDPVTSWESAVGVAKLGSEVKPTPRVAMSPQGSTVLTWIQMESFQGDVWTTRREPGAAWDPPAALESTSASSAFLAAAIDPIGNAAAVWVQSSGGPGTLWARVYR